MPFQNLPKKLSLALSIAASCLAMSNAQAENNRALEAFLAQFMANIGAPRIEFDFEFNSESKSPFKLDHLYTQIKIPLNKALDIPLANGVAKASASRVTPSLELGEKDIVVLATFSKEAATSPLVASITFSSDDQPAKLPLAFELGSNASLRYRITSISMNIPYDTDSTDREQEYNGSCVVEQQSLRLVKPNNSHPNGQWTKLELCEVSGTYDRETKKPKYKFAIATKRRG